MIKYNNNKLKMEGEGFVCSYDQIKEKTHLGAQTLHRLQYFSKVLKVKWDKVYCFEMEQKSRIVHSVIIAGKLGGHTVEYFRREYYSAGAGTTMFYLEGKNKVKATIVDSICKAIGEISNQYTNFKFAEKQDSDGNTVTFELMKIILTTLESSLADLAINLLDSNEELAKYLIKEEII